MTFSRPKEEPAGDSGASKKSKSKHPSSLSHSLFDSGGFGEGEDEDDLFSSPQTTGAAATKKTGKAKPAASKDMDALFDEADQGKCYLQVFVRRREGGRGKERI